MVRFIPVTDEGLRFVADNMREGDADEVRASGFCDLYEGLVMSCERSERLSMVVNEDDIPLAVFGLVKGSALTASGVPWFISSKFALNHKRSFLSESKAAIEEMLTIHPRLSNYVHVENHVSIRWLKWLGFTIKSETTESLTGEKFCQFYLERC